MMMKVILPKVKIRIPNIITSPIISGNQKRCIFTTKTCTYRKQLDGPNIFSTNENIDIKSHNEISNDYNDYSSIDDLQIRLKEHITNTAVFINSYNDYTKKDLSLTTEKELKMENIILSTPNKNFRDIVNTNENKPPNIGSLIEINDPATSESTFGVVLRASKTKFNENYNKILVLTLDNEIKTVYPIDISFHLSEVIDPKWMDSLEIIENRHDIKFYNRLIILDILKSFMGKTLKLLEKLQDPNDNQFLIAFSQYSTPDRIKSISLLDLYESFRLPVLLLSNINESYYNQSIFLFSCHIGMVKSPELWIVTSSNKFNKLTNLVKENCSNEICSGSTYFVNSIINMESLSKVFDDFKNPRTLDKYNEFSSRLLNEQMSQKPKSFDDLNAFFNIWEGKDFKNIINVLKFFIVYPHTSIRGVLEKLSILEKQTIDPSAAYKILEDLKIYNNRQNQLTDIYLSANIMGNTQFSLLAVSSSDELSPNSSNKELDNFINSKNLSDKFPHLRKSKQYYQDHIVYGLPFGKPLNYTSKSSTLGISLEKINSRRYLINIHIPDMITKVSPSTNLFDEIASSSLNMTSLKKLISNSTINILNPKLIEKLSFPDQNLQENEEWFSVGDALLRDNQNDRNNRNPNNVTCLTVSFIYNKYESNPFEELEEKISVSFDSLNTLRIKNINWPTLEKCLNGVREISPFTLFRERKSNLGKVSTKLEDDDIHDINFIFNVMKSHIKIRNLDGASNFDPAVTIQKDDSSNLSKELSMTNKFNDHEQMLTRIQSKSIENQQKFSKSKFLINEIEKFVGKLTSRYCSTNQIPIFAHHQDILESSNNELDMEKIMESDNSELNDEVYISHNNLFLPNYHSNSFYQTLIARDASGYVSMPAYLIGLNYLSKPKIEVFTDENLRNLPLGINHGYVKMLEIFDAYEVLLNQFQILCHIQQCGQNNNYAIFKENRTAMIRQFSYLKRYGYKLDGPLNFQELINQLDNIINSSRLCDYLGTAHKKFWTLKLLEQRLLQEKFLDLTTAGTSYDCIITSTGYEVPSIAKRISRAYCSQLNIEIDVLINLDREISIGNLIECDKVMILDAVNGLCILRESQVLP